VCFGAETLGFSPEITAWPGSSSLRMIPVVLTEGAYDAIASALPKGSARWPMQRERRKCFIQVEAAVFDRMRTMRRPSEDYSDASLRLVELEAAASRLQIAAAWRLSEPAQAAKLKSVTHPETPQ